MAGGLGAAVVLSALVLGISLGCAAPLPRVDGVAIAPRAPDQPWRPPRDAEATSARPPGQIPRELVTHATPLTLAEIVGFALANNPSTRESWAQAQMYADAYGSTRGAYYPTIDAAIAATRSQVPSSSTAAAVGLGGPRSTFVPSLSLSYTLLDFGTRGGTIAAARETAFALSFAHNATLQLTVLNVEQAFYAYAGARAVLDADEQSLREAQASYHAAWLKDSLGMATKVDVLQSRTALAQARLSLDTARAAVQTTRALLAVDFGAPATLQFDVAICLDSMNIADVAPAVDSLVADAMRRRPDVQGAEAYVRAAQADVRAARGAMLPSLNLTAATGYTDATVSSLVGRNYNLAVGISIPVFNGFSHAYDLARARAGVRYQAASADALRQTVSADVVIAYYQLQGATEVVHTSDELFESAAEALAAASARYTAGLGSLLDLLAAQASLALAREQRARSRSSWAIRLAALAYAAGTLDPRGERGIPTGGAPPR